MAQEILLERNVSIAMRDGVSLKANVYRPATDEPVPGLLCRLPYGKDLTKVAWTLDPVKAVEAGYAVVQQDVRGCFTSGGTFYPFVNEARDGYDSVEWVASQPWCNGSVGMFGVSYHGSTQWLAATERPPHLKAIAPYIAPSELYEGNLYQGGAFQLGLALWWALVMSLANSVRSGSSEKPDPVLAARLIDAIDHVDVHYSHLPLLDQPLLAGSDFASFFFDWIRHNDDEGFWKKLAWNRRYSDIEVPALIIGAWYDLLIHGTLENFVRMQKEGATEAARAGQRLLVGPWSHGYDAGFFVDRNFGLLSALDALDLTMVFLRFFDQHLKGKAPPAAEAPVKIFVMGENRWRDEHEWPLARTRYTKWYLHSTGDAAGAGGGLSVSAPGDEPPDSYDYDPAQPCPTVGGPSLLPGVGIAANAGPRDQSTVEQRPDVLVYTSQPLEQDLEVTGPLSLTLFASSSAVDTDFVARLCDVTPEGKSIILQEGIQRARYREGRHVPKLLVPGEVYEFHIDLVATSIVFRPGHRIRLDITSSSFPRFDANTNTGNPLGVDGPGDMKKALQKVFHDVAHPSHVLLPVIPR